MFRPFTTIAILAAFSAGAQASTIYDLANDFSNSSNPNGQWKLLQGNTPLQHFATVNNGNPFDAVLANGIWSPTGGDLNSDVPLVAKTTGSGSQASETDLDFVTGDVITHSQNSGADDLIEWTAPSDGTVDVSGSIWYAHSAVTRSNDFEFTLGSSILDSGIVSTASFFDINHASTFSDSSVAVTAGEVFELDLHMSAGQAFGSLDGVDMTANFTPAAPEPGTLAMFGLGIGGLLLRRRGRSR